MIHNDMALAAGGLKVLYLNFIILVLINLYKVGMLDLLIKSHWYKCSVSLESAHLGITLDDDIDIITSQGDTDINIPSDVPAGIHAHLFLSMRIQLES